MTEFLEILKYTIPSLVVLLTTYFILKKFIDLHTETLHLLKNNLQQKDNDHPEPGKSLENETILPLKLQAYERLILFLERINPANLVVREIEPGLNASQFHKKLLNTIREEYEHNITQQIYVSDSVWNLVRRAKEEVMTLINESMKKVTPDEPAVKLGEMILSGIFEEDKDPVAQAIAAIKKEMQITFNPKTSR